MIDIHLKNKKDIDQKSLIVYELLMKSFVGCEQYSINYKNLTGIFFHDLMRIMTTFIYKLSETKNELIWPKFKNKRLNKFPYIDYLDIQNSYTHKSIDVKSEYINTLALSWKAIYAAKVINTLNPNGKKIGLTDINLNIKKSFKLYLNHGYRICYPQISSITIPNIDKQWIILNKYIAKIIDLIDPDKLDLINNIIEQHILSFTTKSSPQQHYDILIVGTTCDIHNRLLAAEARSNGIPVIVLNHGGATGLLNEPNIGYGDYSYGDYHIGYGKDFDMIKSNNEFLKHLYPYTDWIGSSSHRVKNIYNKNKSIQKLSEIDSIRYMYVPTSFTGFNSYGPFRALSDLSYKEWQKNIIQSFPNLTYKKHPKGYPFFRTQTDDDINNMLDPHNESSFSIIRNDFAETFDMADAYVFDYMSSALTLAIATDKPIVFFDLGINNPTKEAEKAIKERCIVINIEAINDQNLYLKVLDKLDQKLENKYTEKFCFANTNQNREEILLDLIDRIKDKK